MPLTRVDFSLSKTQDFLDSLVWNAKIPVAFLKNDNKYARPLTKDTECMLITINIGIYGDRKLSVYSYLSQSWIPH